MNCFIFLTLQAIINIFIEINHQFKYNLRQIHNLNLLSDLRSSFSLVQGRVIRRSGRNRVLLASV
jgi:hypothetical protein